MTLRQRAQALLDRRDPSARIDLLARALALPLRGMQLAGMPEATRMSPQELLGTSHYLACALLLRRWQAQQGFPSWEQVSQSWEAVMGASAGQAPSLCGAFHQSDQLSLVTDNRESFQLRSRLHGHAKRSIDLATYYIQGDQTGRATVQELAAAAARGVRVRVVADAYITAKKEFEGHGAQAMVEELRQAGVDVRLWRDPARPFDANHRKVLVVDGESFLLGGRNIADHYAGPAWRDVELHVAGPSARLAQELFDRTWNGDAEPAAREGLLLQATVPTDATAHPNFLFLLQCLRHARRSVDVENAYCFAHPALVRAIAQAHARGVRVRLLLNSAETNDLDYANYRLHAGFLEFLAAGAQLHTRRGPGRTLHCKYFIADGEWVSLGSSNLDYYSPRYCTEANIQARSTALAAMCGAWFEQGLSDSKPLQDPAEIAATMAASRVGKALDAFIPDVQ